MSNLERTMNFMRLLHTFQGVERIIPVIGTDRLENDSEHSHTLALTAWYLVDILSPTLNKELVIKYALVHDLVEAYAGDTYIYTKDDTHKSSKQEREHAAQQRIEAEFPDFNELHELIKAYEEKKTHESRFVYALDKIIPVITIYLDSKERNPSFWIKYNVPFHWLDEHKRDKIALSPEVVPLWEELKSMLEKESGELFVPPNESA